MLRQSWNEKSVRLQAKLDSLPSSVAVWFSSKTQPPTPSYCLCLPGNNSKHPDSTPILLRTDPLTPRAVRAPRAIPRPLPSPLTLSGNTAQLRTNSCSYAIHQGLHFHWPPFKDARFASD